MSTGSETFCDYYKTENSDDEENYNDLQSRLYAQIYYAPHAPDERLSETEDPNKESQASNSKPCTEVSSDARNIPTEDNKDFQKSFDDAEEQTVTKDNMTPNASTTLPQDPGINITQHETNIVMKKEQLSPVSSKENNVSQTKPDKGSNKSDHQIKKSKSPNVEPPANVVNKSSIGNVTSSDVAGIKEEVSSQQYSKEKAVQQQAVGRNFPESTNCNNQASSDVSGNLGDKRQRTQCTQESGNESNLPNTPCRANTLQENDVSTNLLKKYEFSKRFINKLYDEKYRELEKRLQENEMGEQVNESNETDKANSTDATNESHEPDETEMDTRYTVIEKNEKVKQKNKKIFQLIDSKNDSDSDDSIFEVPIPPKPQPPLINLQDSDEDSDSSDNNSSLDESDSFDENSSTAKGSQKKSTVSAPAKPNDKDADTINKRSRTRARHESESSTSSYILESEESNEDIVLNCTEIRKGAASLDEIKEMSKNVQNEQNLANAQSLASQDNSTQNECNESAKETPTPAVSENITRSNSAFPECMSFDDDVEIVISEDEVVPNEEVVPSTAPAVTNIDFTDNNSVLEVNIISINDQLRISKKRHHSEIQDKAQSTGSAATRKDSEDDIIPLVQHSISNASTNDQVPVKMPQQGSSQPRTPDTPKSLRNDPSSSENFDFEKIQSKMSKDPRMWAVLDADLMPSPSKRQRFWNARCTHCHRDGHVRFNCPEPRRPARCHMCGIQGHTESRCPLKMCLTCGKKQGSFRKTCESCRMFYCTTCNAIGHKSTECPDLWRKYHQTTKTSELQVPRNLSNVMKPANRLFCCNCTKRGHDSSTCKEYRWSQHFPTPAHVSNYMTGPKYTEDSAKGKPRDFTQHKVPQTETAEIVQPPQNIRVEPPASGTQQPYLKEADFVAHSVSMGLKKSIPPKDLCVPDTSLFNSEQLDGAIYKCGVYKGTSGRITNITFKVDDVKHAHVEGLMKKLIFPTFLEKLTPIINFRAIIYYNKNRTLMACIKSPQVNPRHLQKLFYQWIVAPDIEKNARICTDLPSSKSRVLVFMRTKLAQLGKVGGDPDQLRATIDKMKESLKPGLCTADIPDILRLQRQLNMLILKQSPVTKRLRNHLLTLEKTPGFHLPMSSYLMMMLMYNEIFAPYTMKNIDNYTRIYYARLQKRKSTGENEKESKAKRKLPGTFGQAVHNSKKHKGGPTEHMQTTYQSNFAPPPVMNQRVFQPYTVSNATTVSDTIACKFTDPSVGFSLPNAPCQSNVPLTGEPIAAVRGNIPLPTNFFIPLHQQPADTFVPPSQLPANVPMSSLQLPANVSIPQSQLSAHVSVAPFQLPQTSTDSRLYKDTIQQSNIIECIDLVDEPGESTLNATTQSNNDRNVNPPMFVKKNGQIMRYNIRSKMSRRSMFELEKKGIVERIQHEAPLAVMQRARKIVADAYEFGLPHMDKAARDLEIKINTKSVTRKQIKTLRRLILLERAHRREVNDIYNNLM